MIVGAPAREAKRAARPMPVLGRTVPVARVGHLIATRLLAVADVGRPKDHDQLRELLRLSTSQERAMARDALLLAARRGRPRADAAWALLDATVDALSTEDAEPGDDVVA